MLKQKYLKKNSEKSQMKVNQEANSSSEKKGFIL